MSMLLQLSRSDSIQELLDNLTAEQIMTTNPVCISQSATISQATALMNQYSIHALPVVDDKKIPIGVISSSDIMIHNHEYLSYFYHKQNQCGPPTAPSQLPPTPSEKSRPSLSQHPSGHPSGPNSHLETFQGDTAGSTDTTPVRDVMTPTIFAVVEHQILREIIKTFLELKVHHLYVRGEHGIVKGVISPLDILRSLL